MITISGTKKPIYDDQEVYPNQNMKEYPDFRKDMNQVAANVFRQGYSTRTYRGMDIFRYREDNVQRNLKMIEH